MVDIHGTNRAAGITRLSAYLDRYHQPLFLQRNVQQALTYHESHLKGAHRDEVEVMAKTAQFQQSWQPPNKRILNELSNRQLPDFEVQVKSIKPQPKENLINGDQAHKRRRLARLSCEIEATIWEVRPAGEPNVICVRDSQEGTLQARQSDHSVLPEFHVSMPPIVISTSRMKCTVGEDGRWHRALMKNYHLVICIRFSSFDDAKAYFDLTEPDQSAERIAVSKSIYLGAQWRRFPRCPLDGELLPMHVSKSGVKSTTSYALDANCGFRISRDSILEEYNKIVRVKADAPLHIRPYGPNGLQVPRIDPRSATAVVNGDHNGAIVRTIKLGFVWCDRESYVEVKGFSCAICERRRFPSSEQLLHHLRNSHPYFTSQLLDASRGRFAKLNLDYVIELALAPNFTDKRMDVPPTKREQEADRAIDWLAPKRPFDIQAYLNGANDWIRDGTRSPKGRPRKQDSARKREASRHSVPTSKANAPEEVADLPLRPEKKVKIPRIKGGKTLFRLDSKRSLKPGEMVDESDDDIDTEWMKPRRDTLTERAEMSNPGKAFSNMWNDHLERKEHLCGDAFLGDATVRFLRSHRDNLVAHGYAEYMEALLACCHENGIIEESFLQYGKHELRQGLLHRKQSDREIGGSSTPIRTHKHTGVESFRNDDDDASPSSATRRSARKLLREAKSPSNNSTRTTSGPVAAGRSPSLQLQLEDTKAIKGEGSPKPDKPRLLDGVHCVCGEEVNDMHRVILCTNLKAGCPQPKYHMRCLNLWRRDPDWLCPLCARSAQERSRV